MILLLENENPVLSWIEKNFRSSHSELRGHDKNTKEGALYAVKILQVYKKDVHCFTDEIVESWYLPRQVMDRYHFDDVEQLNEWLDDLS